MSRPRLIAVCLLILAVSRTYAETALPIKCSVGENGELEMWEENGEKIMIGVGGVTVTRGDQHLEADRIVVWSGKVNHCYAEGNVVLRKPGGDARGETFVYDFDTRNGWFVSPRITAESEGKKWYIGGQTAKQISSGTMKALDSWISTCGFDRPHYRFQAREITLHVGRYIAAKHCILFFGNVPVFYFPYIFRDLKHDWPWMRYKAGKDSEWGLYSFARIGFDTNPVTKLIVGADYREQWGWGWPLILKYRSGDKYFGKVDTYYIDEWSRHPEVKRIYAGDVRYRTKWYHRHRLGTNWRLDAEYEDFSDDTFLRDYFEREAKTGKDPESYAYLRGVWENSAVTGLFRARKPRFLTQTEYLPQIGYRLMSRPIWGNRAYLSSDVEVAHLRKEYDHNRDLPSPRSIRMDSLTELHVPFNLFRFLEFEVFAGTRQSWYEKTKGSAGDEENLNDDSFWRGAGLAGAGLSSTIWKTYDVKNDFMRMDGLRHVIIPRITFTDITKPTSSGGEPFLFDEADVLNEAEFVTVSLTNRFQSSSGGSRDFLFIKIESDYFLRDSHAEREGLAENWAEIEGTMRILPHPKFSVSQTTTYDPGDKELSEGSISIAFNPIFKSRVFAKDIEGGIPVSSNTFEMRGAETTPAKWSFGYRNSFVRDDYSTNTFTLGGTLSDNWHLSLSLSFEAMEDDWEKRSITLRRNFHKWIMDAIFERDDENDKDTFFISFYPEGLAKSFLTFGYKFDDWSEREL